MSDRRETAAPPPGAAHGVTPPVPASDTERVLLLECRLEQMRSALEEARDEADRARTKLAGAHAREAEHARRAWRLHEELSEARAEVAALHRRLEQSEALRAEVSGHLFEAGERDDTEELRRLRTRLLAEDQRAVVQDRTVERLRERVDELLATRETLLTRIAEWQFLIREDGPEALDLSEFLSDLRREIIDLEYRTTLGDARERHLRQRLADAGIDPEAEADRRAGPDRPTAADSEPIPTAVTEVRPTVDVETPVEPRPATVPPPSENGTGPTTREDAAPTPSVTADPRPARAVPPARAPSPAPTPAPASAARPETDALVEALLSAGTPGARADMLLRLGKAGDARAVAAVVPWMDSAESSVRAAAYEAVGRLLEPDPVGLEPHVRAGLADPDARVRRRVALSAATSRKLDARPLLEPLVDDPDPQVRRVVREVLRQAPTRSRTPSPVTEDRPTATPAVASPKGVDAAAVSAPVAAGSVPEPAGAAPGTAPSHPSVPLRSARG